MKTEHVVVAAANYGVFRHWLSDLADSLDGGARVNKTCARVYFPDGQEVVFVFASHRHEHARGLARGTPVVTLHGWAENRGADLIDRIRERDGAVLGGETYAERLRARAFPPRAPVEARCQFSDPFYGECEHPAGHSGPHYLVSNRGVCGGAVSGPDALAVRVAETVEPRGAR